MTFNYEKEKEIKEIKEKIKKFAEKDLYSVNCEEVKYLYKRLHEIEDEYFEERQEDNFEPYFIDGSDVPICGHYE